MIGKDASSYHSQLLPLQSLYYQKGDRVAHPSKANKEAKLVERKVCFISEAGNQTGRADSCLEGQTLIPGPIPLTDS